MVSSSELSSELTSPFAPEEKIQQIAQQECALDLQVKRVETSRRLYKGVTIKFGHGQDGSPARATILGFESLRATPLAFPCAQVRRIFRPARAGSLRSKPNGDIPTASCSPLAWNQVVPCKRPSFTVYRRS